MTTDELEIDLQEQRDTILKKKKKNEVKQWSTKASQPLEEVVDVNEDEDKDEDEDEDEGVAWQHN